MNAARGYHTATLLLEGNVLVTGGYNGNSLNSVELYDTSSGKWSAKQPMSIDRYYHTATLLTNGQVLVVSGRDGSFYSKTVEMYNPASNTWASISDMPSNRGYHSATLLANGNVLAVGGMNSSTIVVANADMYSPTTNF